MQADRDAWERDGPRIFHCDMTGPECLAAHRELGAREERARVVAWLRECLAEHEANVSRKGQITERRHHIAACTNIIAAIERGGHTACRAAKGE